MSAAPLFFRMVLVQTSDLEGNMHFFKEDLWRSFGTGSKPEDFLALIYSDRKLDKKNFIQSQKQPGLWWRFVF